MSNRTFYASTYVVADGVTKTWPFSFAGVNTGQESGTTPYLHPEDVKVQENYTDAAGNKQTVQRTGVLNAPNQITIDGPAVLAGREIRIYRETELRFPLVDYRDLQSVSEQDLDLANRQAIFVAQENHDTASFNLMYGAQGHFDAKMRRIVNIADGVDSTDAINLRQFNHAIRVPFSEPPLNVLPPVAMRTGKLLAFDSNGQPVLESPVQGSALELELALLQEGGAAKIGYRLSVAGAVYRRLSVKLGELATIADFGAVPGTDCSAAITAMAAAKGFVVIPAGEFLLSTGSVYELKVMSEFQLGAAVNVAAGTTLRIGTRIASPNQWIFTGAGAVVFRVFHNSGEDSQDVQAAWFGVLPTNALVVDISDRLQRALNGISTQTREGRLHVGIGSFHVSKQINVPRGVKIQCATMRRTIWDVSGAGDYPIFVTAGSACGFADFQFEYPTGQAVVRTAPYIWVKHGECDIQNIWVYPTTCAILVDGPRCTVKNIRATYGLDPRSAGTDTSLIWVRVGSVVIDDVQVLGTTFAPHSLVRVGHDVTISNVRISNIESTAASVGVFFDGRDCIITRCRVDGVLMNTTGAAANSYDGVIRVVTRGTSLAEHLILTGLTGNSSAASLIHVEAHDTSIVSNIVVSDATLQGGAGDGVRLLNKGTGAIRNISFDSSVEVSGRTNPLVTEGAVTKLALPTGMRGVSYSTPLTANVTITPGATVEVSDFRTAIFAGRLEITSTSPNVWGAYAFRSAGSSEHMTLMYGSAVMAGVTTNLTGTTGEAGKFTVGLRRVGTLVMENRTSSSLVVCFTMNAGY